MADATARDTVLLERFGLIAEEDFAAFLGIGVKSLKNRPRMNLPDYVKVGRKRYYVEKSVREYLERNLVQCGSAYL